MNKRYAGPPEPPGSQRELAEERAQYNREEYAHRFPTYWTKAERETLLEVLNAHPKEDAPRLLPSELRRILDTVEALEKDKADLMRELRHVHDQMAKCKGPCGTTALLAALGEK